MPLRRSSARRAARTRLPALRRRLRPRRQRGKNIRPLRLRHPPLPPACGPHLFEANKDVATRRAAWGSLWATVGTLGYYAAYAIIIARTVSGGFSVGDLTFLAGSFRRLRDLLEGMLSRFTQIADCALYLKDLFAFCAIEPEVTSPSDPVPFPDPIREGFRFERVSFRYPGTDQWVLEDLSFTLRAGETVALVGENGADKTTLAKLLAQGGRRAFHPAGRRVSLGAGTRDLRLR